MQEQRENELIERLRESIQTNYRPTGEYSWHRQTASPSVSVEELVQAQAQLGFELPSFLQRLYLEVGNGGFGPGYGLFPLNVGSSSSNSENDSLVTAYLGMRSMTQKDIDTYWADEEEKPSLWPERVLMINDWGCNIYSCLDCSSAELPIFRMDSNENFMIEWAFEAPSLQQWLETWLDGRPLFPLDWQQAAKIAVSRLRERF